MIDISLDTDELKKPLEDYCEEHFGDIVKIYRAPRRLGLIAAKNFGGRMATGKRVLTTYNFVKLVACLLSFYIISFRRHSKLARYRS